jgi:hypothetical protein
MHVNTSRNATERPMLPKWHLAATVLVLLPREGLRTGGKEKRRLNQVRGIRFETGNADTCSTSSSPTPPGVMAW